MHDELSISPDEFLDIENTLKANEPAGLQLNLAISPDPSCEDSILYCPRVSMPQCCPQFSIHKNRVERLNPLYQVECQSSDESPQLVWVAEVFLREFDPQDAELHQAFLAIQDLSGELDAACHSRCENQPVRPEDDHDPPRLPGFSYQLKCSHPSHGRLGRVLWRRCTQDGPITAEDQTYLGRLNFGHGHRGHVFLRELHDYGCEP